MSRAWCSKPSRRTSSSPRFTCVLSTRSKRREVSTSKGPCVVRCRSSERKQDECDRDSRNGHGGSRGGVPAARRKSHLCPLRQEQLRRRPHRHVSSPGRVFF